MNFSKITISLITLLVLFSACEEDTVSDLIGSSENYTYSDVITDQLKEIDKNDIIAELIINSSKSQFIENEIIYQNGAYVYSLDKSTNTYRKLNMTSINDSTLYPRKVDSSVYVNAVDLNFDDTGNNIHIDKNEYFSEIDTTIFLKTPIEFSNINFGDTISRNKNFTLKWNNFSSKYVFIRVSTPGIDSDTPITHFGFYTDNLGEHTFPKGGLKQLSKGLYSIEIEVFDNIFLYDKTGKIILGTFESKEMTHVYFE